MRNILNETSFHNWNKFNQQGMCPFQWTFFAANQDWDCPFNIILIRKSLFQDHLFVGRIYSTYVRSTIIEKVGKNTSSLIGGDFEAKVGQPSDSENCLGKFSIGGQKHNGQRLCTFKSLENLVVSGTTFHEMRSQLFTWRSDEKVTKNQIDHILINQRCRSAVNNIQVRGQTSSLLWPQTLDKHHRNQAQVLQ